MVKQGKMYWFNTKHIRVPWSHASRWKTDGFCWKTSQFGSREPIRSIGSDYSATRYDLGKRRKTVSANVLNFMYFNHESMLAKKLVMRNLMKIVDVLKNITIWLSGANVETIKLWIEPGGGWGGWAAPPLHYSCYRICARKKFGIREPNVLFFRHRCFLSDFRKIAVRLII